MSQTCTNATSCMMVWILSSVSMTETPLWPPYCYNYGPLCCGETFFEDIFISQHWFSISMMVCASGDTALTVLLGFCRSLNSTVDPAKNYMLLFISLRKQDFNLQTHEVIFPTLTCNFMSDTSGQMGRLIWHFWGVNYINSQFSWMHINLQMGGIHHVSVVIYSRTVFLTCLLNLKRKLI